MSGNDRDPDGLLAVTVSHVIDIHAHFVPPKYCAALAAAGLERLDGGMPIPHWSRDQALEVMDRHGVDTAILSISSPGLNFCAADAEVALACNLNDAAATLVADSAGRFGGFATLPVGAPIAALREIDRALDDLSLDGFILHTNHKGHYPGHESWLPILDALNERNALVLLHPTSPDCPHCMTGGRPAPLIEFPFDTTRAVVDLIYSGALARFPDIRFILPHGGGTLPYLADRIAGFSAIPGMAGDSGLDPQAVRIALSRLYYDTALAFSPMHIDALRHIAPVENLMFGSDWPFSPERMVGAALGSLRSMVGLSDEERSAILSGNARRLLRRI